MPPWRCAFPQFRHMHMGQQRHRSDQAVRCLAVTRHVVGVHQQADVGQAERLYQGGRLGHRVQHVRLAPSERLQREGDPMVGCPFGPASQVLTDLPGGLLDRSIGWTPARRPAAEDDQPYPGLLRACQGGAHVPFQSRCIDALRCRLDQHQLGREHRIRRFHRHGQRLCPTTCPLELLLGTLRHQESLYTLLKVVGGDRLQCCHLLVARAHPESHLLPSLLGTIGERENTVR